MGLPILDKHQEAYVQACLKGRGNTLNSTVAGGGKSTMQCVLYDRLLERVSPSEVMVACLNKHNKTDMESRLPEGSTVRTYDSLAYRIMASHLRVQGRGWKFNGSKTRRLVEYYGKQVWSSANGIYSISQINDLEALEKLYNFCLNTLTPPDDWGQVKGMATLYGLDLPPERFTSEGLKSLLKYSVEGIGSNKKYALKEEFTFEELRWFVYYYGLEPSQVPTYLLTDEAQDRNAAQDHLVKLFSRGGQECAVGDPRQQLYMFMGANPEQWRSLVDGSVGGVYHSPVTYRCSKAVVEYAQHYEPQIEAASHAIEGRLLFENEDYMYSNLKPGDFVLCMTNAKAITVALQYMLKTGKPMLVIGRDVGKMLNTLVQTIVSTFKPKWEGLDGAIEDWRKNSLNFLLARNTGSDSQLQSIEDRASSLLILYRNATLIGVNNLEDFCKYVESFYGEREDSADVPLASTVWKAKGLQAETVYIPKKELDARRFKKAWEAIQFHNACYVAVTRAQHTLVIVSDFDKVEHELEF